MKCTWHVTEIWERAVGRVLTSAFAVVNTLTRTNAVERSIGATLHGSSASPGSPSEAHFLGEIGEVSSKCSDVFVYHEAINGSLQRPRREQSRDLVSLGFSHTTVERRSCHCWAPYSKLSVCVCVWERWTFCPLLTPHWLAKKLSLSFCLSFYLCFCHSISLYINFSLFVSVSLTKIFLAFFLSFCLLTDLVFKNNRLL